MNESEGYTDEFGTRWEREVAHFGVGLKLDCPNGSYVSFVTGLGRQGMTYQVMTAAPHPSLPWPPIPDSPMYGERCPCEVCGGRLVGDTVDAILNEADAIQATMTVNEDTYQLRYLESAADFVLGEAQRAGYGVYHHPNAEHTITYVGPERRVTVQYTREFEEVAYRGTVAGAVDALRSGGR